jgi:hypothetical protein
MNAIRHDRIGVVENPDGSIDIVVPPGMANEFKQMVKKGTDLSPNKHVEITDFADRLLGRDKWVGPCMKQAIHGYPHYPKPQAEVVQRDIVGDHWDIPSDKKKDS